MTPGGENQKVMRLLRYPGAPWGVRGLVGVAAALLLVAAAGPAAAGSLSPTYVSSEPADGAELENAPEEVTVTFDEPVDESSKLRVTDECGRTVDDGVVETFANRLSVGIAKEPSGRYDVLYRAVGVGGATGSELGTFSFEVLNGPSCGPAARGDHGGGHGSDTGGHGDGHGGSGDGQDHGGSGVGHHGGSASGGGHAGDHAGGTAHSGDHVAAASAHGGHSGGEDDGHGSSVGHGGKHGRHGAGQGQHGAGRHGDDGQQPSAAGPGTTPAGGQELVPSADTTALLLALALVVGFAVLGGWLLRIATKPA